MILCRSLLLAFWSSTLLTLSSAYIVTTEKWEADKPLVPGSTLFYNVVVEDKDTVVLVDIILANGVLGNTTVIFGDSDLRKKDDRNAGFDVPFVPPGKRYTVRVVETSSKKFLADSPLFEIFAPDGTSASSASTLPPTTLPSIPNSSTPTPSGNSTPASSSTPNAPSSSSPSTSAPAETESSSKTPVGAIAGGVVGGIVVIGLIILFLLWRRRRGARPAKDLESEKNLGPPSPGPHAVEPYTLPPSSVRQGAATTGGASTLSLTGTGTDARSTAGPLPSKLGYGFAGTTTASLDAGSSSASAMPISEIMSSPTSTELTRVEQLRRERERINRELAALENRSHTAGSSSYGGASSYMPPSSVGSGSNHESLAEQLAVLQTQIRQLEERERHREPDLPPVYDGPPAPATNTDTNANVPPVTSKH